MPIERFTQEQFEASLPVDKNTGNPLWQCLGYKKGELVYVIPVTNTNKRIVVRSSIGYSGKAAATGQDSIRHRVEYLYKGAWRQAGRGKRQYTTRLPGWEERLTKALRELYGLAVKDSKAHNSYGRRFDVHQKPEEKQQIPSKPATPPPSTEHSEPQQVSAIPEPEPEPEEEKYSLDELLAIQEQKPQSTGRTPNDKQQKAITADPHKPLRVLAPPGAGKTFVIARRYGFLLQHGAKPDNIVAVTFNRDMADELLHRIIAVNPALEHIQNNEPEAQCLRQITTIHALCYRILKAEGDHRSVPGYKSRVKAWQVKQALIDIIEDVWTNPQYRPAYKEVQAYIDEAKFRGLTSAEDMQFFGGIRDRWDRLVEQQLHQARFKFDAWCKRNRVITFADMLYDVEQRLKTDAAFRQKWQQKIQYLIIDEGQDTSAQAMRVLTILAEPQNFLTIVGDSDQLLYRFAGSTPEANLYDGFESRYPEGNTVKLQINYRSTQEIVTTCKQLIERNYQVEGNEFAPYEVKYMKDAQPRPNAPEGDAVEFEMYPDAVSEAAAVAQKIKMLLDEGYKPDDIFVGARTRAQTGFLEGPMVQSGIPYINLVGQSFFGQKHVHEVVAYMRLAYNEADHEAFGTVYNIASNDFTRPWGKEKGEYCHHRYLGKKFLQACYDSGTGKPEYKWRWKAVKSRRSYGAGVEDLDILVGRIQKVLEEERLDQVIQFVLDECYLQHLQAEEGLLTDDASQNGKVDDFETLKEIARRFESPSEFFEYVHNAEVAAEAAKSGDWKDHVVISTIHRLKGQERKVVFGIGLGEGFDKQGQEVGLLPHTYSMRPPKQFGILPTGGMGRIEDERDICFVLVSRAKEKVFLSCPMVYHKQELHASRFVREMGLLEGGEENEC